MGAFTVPTKLNIAAVQDALFANWATIAPKYPTLGTPGTSQEMADGLIKILDQHEQADPIGAIVPAPRVFEQVVRAIGSSQTDWSVFLRRLPVIEKCLHGFQPDKVAAVLNEGGTAGEQLRATLKASLQSVYAQAQVDGICGWASILAEDPDHYGHIQRLAAALQANNRTIGTNARTTAALAAIIGGEDKLPGKVTSYLASIGVQTPTGGWKSPGMRFALAAEFLRNVGWPGFKPDTHIMRLFEQWIPNVLEQAADDAREMANSLGFGDQTTIKNIQFSLAGLAITPDGTSPSVADNLLWLLGSQVHTTRHAKVHGYPQADTYFNFS